MEVSIHDTDALRAVSPAALAAYAHARGWHQGEVYRTHSSIYVGDDLPEIIIPRTTNLGDYASAVKALIETFAQFVNQDELAVYRHLVTADRDVIRIRATGSDDGSLGIEDGVGFISGARNLLLAAACSLYEHREVFRAGANREATELVKQMRLGQTDQGSFIVTLLTPVIPPAIPTLFTDSDDINAPRARRLTKHLAGALITVRQATERVATGDGDAFLGAVPDGISANLCEALVQLIEPSSSLDIGVLWASTRPSPTSGAPVCFGKADAPILGEAARSLRERAPRPDVHLVGFVARLKRGQEDEEGSISLTTQIDGQRQSVTAVLEQREYERAVQAHRDRAAVMLAGDLERNGQRWRLLNSTISEVIQNHEPEIDSSV